MTSAIEFGHLDIVREIMANERFSEISGYHLEGALEEARSDHSEIAGLFRREQCKRTIMKALPYAAAAAVALL